MMTFGNVEGDPQATADARLHPPLDVGAQPLETLIQAISTRRACSLVGGGEAKRKDRRI